MSFHGYSTVNHLFTNIYDGTRSLLKQSVTRYMWKNDITKMQGFLKKLCSTRTRLVLNEKSFRIFWEMQIIIFVSKDDEIARERNKSKDNVLKKFFPKAVRRMLMKLSPER